MKSFHTGLFRLNTSIMEELLAFWGIIPQMLSIGVKSGPFADQVKDFTPKLSLEAITYEKKILYEGLSRP